MIEKFIEILKESNNFTIEEINRIKNSIKDNRILEILNVILNKDIEMSNSIEEQEIEEHFKKEGFSDEEINRIKFCILITSKNVDLYPEQEELTKSIKDTMQKRLEERADTTALEEKINSNNIIIKDLSNNKHFNNFDVLENILEQENIDQKSQLELLRDIIIRNISSINSIKITEKSTKEIKLEDEDKIKALFKKYNLNYKKLTEKDIYKLRANINLQRAEDVLKELLKNDVELKELNNSPRILVEILIKSTPEIIIELKELCEDNGLSLKDNIEKVPNILYPPAFSKKHYRAFRNATHEGDEEVNSGASNYFKEAINFFNSENLDVKDLNERCYYLFIVNTDILKYNYFTLKNMYNFSMTERNMSYGLASGNAVENIDRYIELSPIGYEYIEDKRSCLGESSDDIEAYILKYMQEKLAESPFALSSSSNKYYKKKKIRNDLNIPIDKEKLQEELSITDTQERKKLENISNLYSYITLELVTEIYPRAYNIDQIEKLEKNNKVDHYTYQINGTRVSRMKVLRTVTAFIKNGFNNITDEMIIYALGYNSILTDKDVENITHFMQYGIENNGIERVLK